LFVIGTAGHVDHGKTTLIKALTGIDPDRLQEEKERGMTIDLGFAWLRLPSGREVSIVDVPGHERFIKNMLAGVGGIDVALLVVAADEGLMPQTEEHLAILDLLQIKAGVVVITKKDLVDAEWLELVEEELRERLQSTTLREAPLLAVSAVTGEGLPELIATLDQLLATTPPKRDLGRPRLSIDRAFTVAGFGTVVTGTLIDGKLSLGQEVEVLRVGRGQAPPLRSRVRGLQTHKRKVETALPGTRVAVNLTGVAVEQLQRGDVVTTPGWLEPTLLVDGRLRLLASPDTLDSGGIGASRPKPLAHNSEVSFHTGAAEAEARVRLLESDALSPGATGWVQVQLAAPLAVAKGDFFIIRSPMTTLGGGQIVNPHPKRHKRGQARVLAALETLAKGSPEEIVRQTLGTAPPVEVATLIEQTHLPADQARAALGQLIASGQALALGDEARSLPAKALVVSAAGWRELGERVTAILQGYHRQNPLRGGMPKEELKSRLALPARVCNESLARWLATGALAEEGAAVRLSTHQARFTPEQQQRVDRLLARMAQTPYTPPSRAEIEQELGASEVLAALLEQGKLYKVSEEIVFLRSAYEEMVRRTVETIRARGQVTAAEVRDLFNTSRKYAIAFLEHLDEERITRRVGDERVLR
jgi:selenocysteine-specific elongation factor